MITSLLSLISVSQRAHHYPSSCVHWKWCVTAPDIRVARIKELGKWMKTSGTRLTESVWYTDDPTDCLTVWRVGDRKKTCIALIQKKKSKDALLFLGLLPFYSANSVHRRRRITYINSYFDLFLTPLIYFFNTLLTYDLPKISTFCSEELLLKSSKWI